MITSSSYLLSISNVHKLDIPSQNLWEKIKKYIKILCCVYYKNMDNNQEINYLKKIISLQDKLLDCYESDSDLEDDSSEGELSYVKKIASLQTKVLESYETDSDEDDLEKSFYHDSSFTVSPELYEYLGDEYPMFADRKSVITAIVHKLKKQNLVDSENNISLLDPNSQGLVKLFVEPIDKDKLSIFSITKHIEHHFTV